MFVVSININIKTRQMKTEIATKKITLSTVKSFIKKNKKNLFINIKSDFDGMTDSLQQKTNGFEKAQETTAHIEHSFGVKDAWFTDVTKNHFETFSNDVFEGYRVWNCCGSFILAIAKDPKIRIEVNLN